VTEWLRLSCKAAVQRGVDRVENAVEIGGDLPVPKPQDAIALGLQPLLSCPIFSGDIVSAVLSAIQFDDQLRREAGEVGDVRADRDLLAKMRAFNRHILQGAPEFPFCFRRVRAQPLRSRPAKAGEVRGAITLPWRGRVGAKLRGGVTPCPRDVRRSRCALFCAGVTPPRRLLRSRRPLPSRGGCWRIVLTRLVLAHER
jgi:hypothetical protein